MDAVLDDETGISELCAFFDGELFCGFVVLLNQGDITHIIYIAVPRSCAGADTAARRSALCAP